LGTYLLKLIPCRKSNWLHMGSIPVVPTGQFVTASFSICFDI